MAGNYARFVKVSVNEDNPLYRQLISFRAAGKDSSGTPVGNQGGPIDCALEPPKIAA